MHDRARLRPYLSLSRAKHTRVSVGSYFVASYFCDAGLSPAFRSVGRTVGRDGGASRRRRGFGASLNGVIPKFCLGRLGVASEL